MKIRIEKYNPYWQTEFKELKRQISEILIVLTPSIEHIGSTSIPGLAAKPIIDIAVGIKTKLDLNLVVDPMIKAGFIYYKAFNEGMPNRRLFIGLKEEDDYRPFQSVYAVGDNIPHEEINERRKCHIHIWEVDSPDWIRHIAFREYIKSHPEVKKTYEEIKWRLSKEEWEHGMAYNDEKNEFIKEMQALAIEWYNKS